MFLNSSVIQPLMAELQSYLLYIAAMILNKQSL